MQVQRMREGHQVKPASNLIFPDREATETTGNCRACGMAMQLNNPQFECVANRGQPCSAVNLAQDFKPVSLDPYVEPVAPPSAVDAILRETEWQSMRDLARVAVRSGVLPNWITTEEKAQTVIAIGRELGVGPMTSLRLISLTDDGKIIMEAHLIRALVLRRIPGARMDVTELSADRCKIVCSRPNHETRSYEWTSQDSIRAGLSEKRNHKCYPKQMNLARATTLSAAAYFGDADCGIYTPEDFAGFAESEEERKARVESARASASKAVELAAESGAVDPKVADQLRKLVASTQDDRKLATIEKKAADKVAALEKSMQQAKEGGPGTSAEAPPAT